MTSREPSGKILASRQEAACGLPLSRAARLASPFIHPHIYHDSTVIFCQSPQFYAASPAVFMQKPARSKGEVINANAEARTQ